MKSAPCSRIRAGRDAGILCAGWESYDPNREQSYTSWSTVFPNEYCRSTSSDVLAWDEFRTKRRAKVLECDRKTRPVVRIRSPWTPFWCGPCRHVTIRIGRERSVWREPKQLEFFKAFSIVFVSFPDNLLDGLTKVGRTVVFLRMPFRTAAGVGHGGHGRQDGQDEQEITALHLHHERKQKATINNDVSQQPTYSGLLKLIIYDDYHIEKVLSLFGY